MADFITSVPPRSSGSTCFCYKDAGWAARLNGEDPNSVPKPALFNSAPDSNLVPTPFIPAPSSDLIPTPATNTTNAVGPGGKFSPLPFPPLPSFPPMFLLFPMGLVRKGKERGR